MLARLKIKTLLVATLGLLMALVVIVGLMGLRGTERTRQVYTDMSLRDAKSQALVMRIKLLMETNRSQILQALQHNPNFAWATLHDHALDVHFKSIADSSEQIRTLWDDYLKSMGSDEEKRLAQDWYDKSGELGLKSIAEAAAAVRAGRWDESENVLIRAINPTYRIAHAAATELNNHLESRSVRNAATVDDTIKTARWLLLFAVASAIAIALLGGIILMRGITGPLTAAVDVARRVAAGDLTSEIEVTGDNEMGQLLQALKSMNQSLMALVGTVRKSSVDIAVEASQIASGSKDLSHRTETQASNLEETAASMEQLLAMVRNNTDAATRAAELARTAGASATEGGTAVGLVVTTMEEIATSSRTIGDIVSVIDSIAFQTNILALNAAVEAARAGDHGRGFAVVASEVQGLAQRSAAAAKQIKSLVLESISKVDAGSIQAAAAGTKIHTLVEEVKTVAALVEQITGATVEQTNGIGQVGSAITMLDETTQKNAALVQESAAAAASLSEQAARMTELVGTFQVERNVEEAELKV